jgi:hypothetical protein
LLVAVSAVIAFAIRADDAIIEVTVTGPTVIAFFPPVPQAELDADDDGSLSSGIAHLNFVLEDLHACLAPRQIAMRFEFTRALTLVDGSSVHRIEFPVDWAHAIGVVLAMPGETPQTVFATAGPSGLLESVPQAAWKYFGEPKCKRYEE